MMPRQGDQSIRRGNAMAAATRRRLTPCDKCGRRQLWKKRSFADGFHVRVCRYCKHEKGGYRA